MVSKSAYTKNGRNNVTLTEDLFIQGAETHTGRNTSGETQAFTLEKRKKIVCKYEQMDSYVMMRGLMRISLIYYD